MLYQHFEFEHLKQHYKKIYYMLQRISKKAYYWYPTQNKTFYFVSLKPGWKYFLIQSYIVLN